MREFRVGDKVLKLPVVQGGMGVGVSRSRLAGAVAKEGGIGIISTAQIGYDEQEFDNDQPGCNIAAIKKHIALAKELAGGNGLVGVNVMAALKHYREHVQAAAASGADVVVCGAGLALDLPKLVEPYHTMIAPIVSSPRAAELILKKWDKTYHKTADLIVVEGPGAGGHLGYSAEELREPEHIDFDEIVKNVMLCRQYYEEKYHKHIAVVAGGGIYSREDADHIFGLGVDAIQVASRFVATEECDADIRYKQAYVDAKKEDIVIVKSPVGMPGRALNNQFIQRVNKEKQPVQKCFQCLQKCNPAQVPYCITKALIDAVKGDVDNGLIFCGAKVDQIKEISTVRKVLEELVL